jgi:hypothetical protein
MRIPAVLAVGYLLLTFTGCKPKAEPAAPPKPTVVGRWQVETGGTIEFRADGTGTNVTAAGVSREIKYRVVDEKTIEIMNAKGQVALHWIIESLTADQLTITVQEAGNRGIFRRIG